MARTSRKKGSPLDEFTSGYQRHRMDPRSIKEWTASRIRRRGYDGFRRWLADRQAEAAKALTALKAMPMTPKVERAVENATEHRDWLRLVRLEFRRQQTPRKERTGKVEASRIRVGSLKREANVFQGGKTE